MLSLFFEKYIKLLLGLAGAALLACMVARCGPWYMCHIGLHGGSPETVGFSLPHIGSLRISYRFFLLICCMALPATVLLFHGARSSAAYLCKSRASLPIFLVSLIFFLSTFFPGFFLEEITSWPEVPVRSVALSLMLGLTGVLFLFIAISGYIADLKVWRRLQSCILTVKLPWFLAGLFIFEFLCANLISYVVFEHLPHVQDSFAQLFHGMIFASGHLTAPSPPLKELFYYEHIINNGRWYSQYPPGHSFLLMLGVLAHAPWIINPLLGAATIVLLYFLGRELYGDAVGRLASLLGLFSPFILFMSSEFMNHAAALLLFTVFLLFYARTLRRQSMWSASLAGAALGWIINIRPLSAVTLSLPCMVYAGWLLMKRGPQYWRSFAALSAVALAFIAILLWFNWVTNENPFLFGYQVLHGNEHLPGFGHAAWGEALTPLRGMQHTLNNFVGLNKYLFEWPIPSLVFVCILFAGGRVNRWDVLLLSSFLCLALGYFCYWYQDWCFGPRFLYEASGCMIILTARGIKSVPYLIRQVLGRQIPVRRIYGATIAILLFCMAYGLITNVPALYRGYSKSYWGADRTLEKTIDEKQADKSLVFIRHLYGRPLMPNSPFLDTGRIYVWDSPDRRKDVMALFPGYRYFLEKEAFVEEIQN